MQRICCQNELEAISFPNTSSFYLNDKLSREYKIVVAAPLFLYMIKN